MKVSLISTFQTCSFHSISVISLLLFFYYFLFCFWISISAFYCFIFISFVVWGVPTNLNIVAQTMKKMKNLSFWIYILYESVRATLKIVHSIPLSFLYSQSLSLCWKNIYTYISFLPVQPKYCMSVTVVPSSCNGFKILWTSIATLPCHNEFSLLSLYIFYFSERRWR